MLALVPRRPPRWYREHGMLLAAAAVSLAIMGITAATVEVISYRDRASLRAGVATPGTLYLEHLDLVIAPIERRAGPMQLSG